MRLPPTGEVTSPGLLGTVSGMARTTAAALRSGASVTLGAASAVTGVVVGAMLVLTLADVVVQSTLVAIAHLGAVAGAVAVGVRQIVVLRQRNELLERATHATEHERAARLEAQTAAHEAGEVAARLAAAEQRYRALVEGLPAVVYLDRVDSSHGRIT